MASVSTDAGAVSVPVGRAGAGLSIGAGLVVFATVLAKSNGVLLDPDPYYHIVTGRWILSHLAVPHHDPFSHSMLGAPWVAHEWLSEVVSALAYDGLGWTGLVLVTAALFGAAIGLLVHALGRYVEPAYALIGGIMAWGLCFPHLLARPHLVALLPLVVWTAALVTARAENRAPPPALALLIVLWANLHGSYMFGLGLAGLLAAEALFDAPDRRAALHQARLWAWFLVPALLAALVTPNGLSGVVFPLNVVRMDFALSWVNEWQSPDFHQTQPIEGWLLLGLLGTLLAGVRLPVTRILLLLMLLHMALRHQRHAEILGLVAPLLVAPALAPQLGRLPALARLPSRRVWLAAALGLALATTAWRLPVADPVGRYTPSAALAAARAHGATGRVLNEFNFGAYLIFEGVPPFIDSRFDLYGDPFLKRFNDLAELPGLLAEYDIAWTLLKTHGERVVLMDHLPGWTRIYTDDLAVVHVRTGSTSPR